MEFSHSLQKAHYLKYASIDSSFAKILHLEEEAKTSFLIEQTGVQDAFLFRGRQRAMHIACYLIDDAGIFDHKKLAEFLKLLKENLYIIYPGSPSDAGILQHILAVLSYLLKTGEKFIALRMPVHSKYVERLLLYSLGKNLGDSLNDALLRRAVLSALLTPLRQNIGSCFATAPAMYIQSEQIGNLLADLEALVMTGKLTRIIAGKEYAAPLSPSWGVSELRFRVSSFDAEKILAKSPGFIAALGSDVKRALSLIEKGEVLSVESLIERSYRDKDLALDAKCRFKALTDHALLKAWEFTIASYSDYKSDFSKWNLHASLGLDPHEKGGIGEVIHSTLKNLLSDANAEVQELNKECEMDYHQTRAAEALLRGADSYDKARRLKTEVSMKHHALEAQQRKRDAAHARAEKISELLPMIIEHYAKIFPEHFQEIYDTEMALVDPALYADSPAGFRLVYKHGRRDPMLWTMIGSEKEYEHCLRNFFQMTERELIDSSGIEAEVQKVVTNILHHVQTEVFIKSAAQRLKQFHQKQNMDQGEKTPWSYLSGGNMNTLVSGYYALDYEVLEETCVAKSSMDLLVFILDTLKTLSYEEVKRFEQNKESSMFMFSPTHAFLLKPGYFLEGWMSSDFSYTFARDHAYLPAKNFYTSIELSSKEQEHLTFLFEKEHKINIGPTSVNYKVSISEFRENFTDQGIPHDLIDTFLMRSIPLIPKRLFLEKAKETVSDAGLFSDLLKMHLEKIPLPKDLFITPKVFQNLVLSAIFSTREKISFPDDIRKKLRTSMEKFGLAPPAPFIFADTNWSIYAFAFAVNPGTNKLELWKTDRQGENASPMSVWKEHLSPAATKPWGIITERFEGKLPRMEMLPFLSKRV